MRAKNILSAVLMALSFAAMAAGPLEVGFAISDVTPDLGIYLTGYGRPQRLATNVHSPLTVTAMYVADGETEAALVSLDWCFVDAPLSEEIRRGISGVAGIPWKNIVLCCTHTHSAPHTACLKDKWRGAVDKEGTGAAYARKCIPAIADAVKRAKESRKEASMAIGRGKTKTGISRRGTHETGEVNALFGDPLMIHDDNMTVLHFAETKTGKTIGIVVHCSAHNTAMGITADISSDWCGVMRRRIATRYPAPVMFINGALGDSGPRTYRWFDDPEYHGFSAGCGDGLDSVLEVGYRAANDALDLLEDMRDFRTDLPLVYKVGKLSLPQEIHTPKAEAEKVVAEFKDKKLDPDNMPIEYLLAKNALEAWNRPAEPVFDTEHSLLAIGPVAFVSYPMEVFSTFTLRLRKYSPYQHNLVCSNADGRLAYMPDKAAIARGGYEVHVRKVMRPYVFTPDAGDVMVVQTLKELREMKNGMTK
ncbi:MAG: neutral/alkaline non-lysosomal ceramidase N-terminal domain-containing protein [Victivallaceae bacterium]|nr:neutral/alkaline non-lysosomal ceramidase N-terminal domain-containing protein [Victivallaceae bacterium]